MSKNIWQKIINCLFPETCLVCGQGREPLCLSCLENLPRLKPADWPTLPNLDQTLSALPYPALAKILHAYKYQGLTNLAGPLAKILADYLAEQLPKLKNAVIIPLPSHSRRISERGFDHLKLITDQLSNWPVYNDILIRTKYTPHQVKLNRNERLTNLKDCFFLGEPQEITGRTVILIDDVVTTGSSLSEAAKELKQGWPKKIIGLTLAYEQLNQSDSPHVVIPAQAGIQATKLN